MLDLDDRYELLEPLGTGGTATVHAARDRVLGRRVAVKILAERLLDDDVGRERFRREARAVARLASPYIVRLLDAGEVDGHPFLVTEIVEGPTLAAALGSLDRTALLVTIERLARAVDHAHEQGVVHRDIKPSNVLLTADGRPKLTDFGLVRFLDGASGLTGQATPGTPAYMAPEQADRRFGAVGPATDVHALGAILYEGLTGQPPYGAGRSVEILARLAEGEPDPPGPAVEAPLAAILQTALARDPDDRYPSAGALADDLVRHLEGRPVAARRRRAGRPLALGVGLSMAALAIAIALTLRPGPDRAPEPAAAGDPAPVDAGGRRAEALAGLSDARRELEAIENHLYTGEIDDAAFRDLVATARGRLERTLDLDPDLVVGHFLLGRCLELEGHLEAAAASLGRAIELDPTFAAARFRLGLVLTMRSFEETIGATADDRRAGHQRATETSAAAIGHLEAALASEEALESEIDLLATRAMIAWVGRDRGTLLRLTAAGIERHEGTREVAVLHWLSGLARSGRLAIAAFDRALDVRPRYPAALLARSIQLVGTHDLSAAEADLDRLVELQPDNVSGLLNRSIVRLHLGRTEGAIADATRVLELRPDDAPALVNRGAARAAAGDCDEALVDLDRAIATDDAYAWAHINRAMIRAGRGDLPGARIDLDRALEIEPRNAPAHIERSRVRTALGDQAGALADLDAALELEPARVDALFLRGIQRFEMERIPEALADYDAVLRLQPDHAEALTRRGALRAERGDVRGGLSDIERSLEIDPDQHEALVLRGNARGHFGDVDGMIADLERGLALAPPDWPYREVTEAQLARARRR